MTRRMDELNALEEAEAEQLAGCSILNLETEQPVAKLLAALAFVHKRRTDPKLKYGEYIRSARTKDNVRYMFASLDDDDDDEDGDEDDAAEHPLPEAEDRVLDDEGVPTDPFPEASSPEGTRDAPAGADEAAGEVLPIQRDSA